MYGMNKRTPPTQKGLTSMNFNQQYPMAIYITWILVLFLGMAKAHAQEVLLPIQQNPEKSYEAVSTQRVALAAKEDLLGLPFWDDFTNAGPYPDPARWIDQDVFVNKGFAVHPKTYGVATFDILDATGKIYEHATIDNIPFAADHLTSRKISLADYSPSDSLLLTFYYQPQGRGAPPASNDSLVLQFRLPPENGQPAKEDNNHDENGGQKKDEEQMMWQSQWSAMGESLQSFSRDTFPYFKRVAVPITEEKYFHEAFQFRFRNFASFAPGLTIPNYSGTGNVWNIDYVYLDANRSTLDASYFDIAFVSPPQSMLQDLTAMPWSQYITDPESALRNNFQVSIANLDEVSYNYDYKYVIQDEGGQTIRTYSGGSWVIDPFTEEGYQDYAPHANPIVLANPLPTAPAEERHFRIVHKLRQGADGDDFPRNDTLIYDQHFANYFAYDDGSPELVHLTKGSDPGRALQFYAAHADTIEAVDIFLMETINNQDFQQMYQIYIWDSLDPENVIYQSDELFIEEDTNHGTFIRHQLENDVVAEGHFYVGLRQTGTVELRNAIVVGFDKSNNVQHRLFYDAGDGWLQSEMSGVLMIRPVMKRDFPTGVAEPGDMREPWVHVYPNPVSGNWLHVEATDGSHGLQEATIRIFDIRGRLMQEEPYSDAINISTLQNGVYMMRVGNAQKGRHQTLRLIIAR